MLLAGVFALGAGEARAADSTCPPPAGRQLCLTISDTDGVSKSPTATGLPRNHMRYIVTATNVGGSALTNLTLTTVLSDVPANSSGGTTASLVTLSTTPGNATCTETPGTVTTPSTVTCDGGRLAAGASFTLKLGYATSSAEGVTGALLEATATVKEHNRDQIPGDPNPEIVNASNETTYGTDPTKGFSFVPNKPGTKIDVTTSRSSLSFTTPGFEEFFALIQDFANDTSHCFTGITCVGPDAMFGDVTDTLGGVGPFLWQTHLTNITTKADNVDAVHTLDPVPVSVNPANDTFSAAVSFVGYDGVRFSTSGTLPGGLQANTDYFVVSASGTNFKVSTKKGGKAVDITSAGTGQLQAERVEVIGDVKSERVTSCAATVSKVPSIFALQVDATTVDTCVSTRENGWMKH